MKNSKFNKDVTDMLLSKFKDVSFGQKEGRFLADKSYGFDTIFLAARFISRFRFGDTFRKQELQDKSSKYFRDLFCLRDAAHVQNYMTEAVALFCFAGILKLQKRGIYTVSDSELLDFVSSSFENAYVFLYMLCYCMFKNAGIWNEYVEFCKSDSVAGKQVCYDRIRDYIATHDRRVKNKEKEWARFTPKYPVIVLGYANRANAVTRGCRVLARIESIKDISLNVRGKRANYNLPKKNAYLDDFSVSYVTETLRPFLAVDAPEYERIEYSDAFSIDVADTKLDMLDTDASTSAMKRKMQRSRYRHAGTGMVRTVQGEFRKGLLAKVPHVCPICGFSYEKFLVASHIRPYAKCEDTYDAMNPNNGLLMCPLCDKLFESANYMSVDCRTGRIIYDTALENEKDFEYIRGDKEVRVDYIACERKHYLDWHNREFFRKHPDHPLAKKD
ncbi:MAG: HNH endonuclease [Muribaculaceae bacterium]|nr:HNH endonuclease [Muribaculaceae bacterium]